MFGPPRQRRRVDLHHRPDHDELPVRPRVGERRQQVEVQPLVDHAVEADARVRDGRPGPAGSGRAARAPGAKCATSTLLGKAWTFGVPVALGLVQAVAAGEDEVGALAAAAARARAAPAARRGRRTARPCSRRRRAAAVRCVREGQAHRRVVPEQRIRRSPGPRTAGRAASRCASACCDGSRPSRQLRHDDRDAVSSASTARGVGAASRCEDRLLDEEDPLRRARSASSGAAAAGRRNPSADARSR